MRGSISGVTMGGRRGIGYTGGGGGAPSGPLLAWADGSFARSSEASYLTAADAMAWATSNTRRVDAGLFGEALTLIERQQTNQLIRSEELENASWALTSASLSSTSETAPDGATDADILSYTASANARASLTVSSASMPDGTIITASRWHKVSSGGGVDRIDIVQRDAATSVGSGDVTAPVGWARHAARAISVGTGGANIQFRHRNGTAGAATAIFLWGTQIEIGRYETSYIRTGAATATREADQATWVSAEVPLDIREGAAQMRAAPLWTDTDLQASEERWLLSFGGSSDGIRVRNDAGVVKLEAVDTGVVVASKTLTGLVRYAPVTVSWDPAAGTVSWGGVAGAAGTPWAWPGGVSLRVGGILGGASEWDGGLALPEYA